MTLTPPPLPEKERGFNWHKRYLQQTNWTRDLRDYLFKKVGLDYASRALEVGCGTGAILSQIKTSTTVYGLDIQLASVKKAKAHTQNRFPLTCADAFSLPYAGNSFEIVFCHFLLLWLQHPEDALHEMMRVTKASGHIIAFAEPDYRHRVDKPSTLKELGQLQIDALRKQGANPSMGAGLADLFYGAGIKIIERGAIAKSTREPLNLDERELEWATLEADLRGKIPDERIQEMKVLDKAAWEGGERVLHIPTHYIWGRVAGG